MNETILMYNFDKEKARKIQFICLQMHFRIKVISKEDYLKPIGAFLDSSIQSDTVFDGEAFLDEMLVMAGLSDSKLNSFLTQLKKQRVAFIPLKAMVTPNNISWNSIELHKELLEEHEMIKMQQQPAGDNPS